MLKVHRLGSSFIFSLMLTSSGVAHSQTVAPTDLVGRWRSPNFTEWTFRGASADLKGVVTDTFATHTTILLHQDSTWMVYTTFQSQKVKDVLGKGVFVSNGGAWRRNGDTLWLAEDPKWLDTATEYRPDLEVVYRDTLKTRPQPPAKAWKSYRATMRDQRLSIGTFAATGTPATAEPFVCPSSSAAALQSPTYDRVVCPGVYDRRAASTP